MGIKIELKGSDEIDFANSGSDISDRRSQTIRRSKVKTFAKWWEALIRWK
jgi:hypothetical protein